MEQDLHTLKLHNAKKVEITSRLRNEPFSAQKVKTFSRPHTQLLESPAMDVSKRESLNIMAKRRENDLIPLKSSLPEPTPGELAASPAKIRISTNRTMND